MFHFTERVPHETTVRSYLEVITGISLTQIFCASLTACWLSIKAHSCPGILIQSIMHSAILILKSSKQLCSRGGYRKAWLTGSSGGGFSALRFASYFSANVLASNSQLYPDRYPFWDDFVKKLKDARDECAALPLPSPPRLGSRMIIYQNIHDSHHVYKHLMPFLKTFSTEQAVIKKSNVKIRRLGQQHSIILFESNVSNSAQKHHSIVFPRQLKHDEVLCSYLDSTAESRHEVLSVY